MFDSILEKDYDVIVIGGGLSGLVAADAILRKDPLLRVVVIEATHRLGGRIMSMPMETLNGNFAMFDFGGNFVKQSHDHLINLLDRLRLKLVPLEESGDEIFKLRSGILNKRDTFKISIIKNNIGHFFKNAEQFRRLLRYGDEVRTSKLKYLDSITLEQFARKFMHYLPAMDYLNLLVRSALGRSIEDISALFFLMMYDDFKDEKPYIIQGGAEQICTSLSKNINSFIFNEPVVSIMQISDLIAVQTTRNIYWTSYLIVAIPPEEILRLELDLGKERRDFLNSYSTQNIIVFTATYSKKFWKESGFSGRVRSTTKPGLFCFDSSTKNYPALSGYIEFDFEDEADSRQKILKQLSMYFGNEALQPISYTEVEWKREHFRGGCPMSSPGLNKLLSLRESRFPIGRIFWAGTEFAGVSRGYMNGAVQAGYRAAMEVLYDFRPQCLEAEDIEKIRHIKRMPCYYFNPQYTGIIAGTLCVLVLAFIVRKIKGPCKEIPL